MKKTLGALVGLLVIGIGACQLLLPERFAVNAPLGPLLFGRPGPTPEEDVVVERLRVPEGFAISLYAQDIPNARMLVSTSAGDLLVSSPGQGQVLLVERDGDGDGRADGRRVLLADLDRPHGLALHDGWLYVAEASAIGRIQFAPDARATEGALEHVVTALPKGGNHWSRQVAFGPDGWMYVSVGSTCNVCDEKDERRAAMLRFRPDGSEGEIFARGLRNSVGYDWQPTTGHLYATDNGRDLLGDDVPPCELNRIERGGFYGWPLAYGDRVPDPDFGQRSPAEIASSIPPAHPFRAHNAPLGIRFLRAGGLPGVYRGAALVALHGSWNRTRKDGYKVVSLHWGDDGRIEEREFATGFELDGDVIGRPVDLVEGPGAEIYLSDDYGGSIYRITY